MPFARVSIVCPGTHCGRKRTRRFCTLSCCFSRVRYPGKNQVRRPCGARGLYARLSHGMACKVTSELELLIDCDRRMIRTYICLYIVVLLAFIASVLFLGMLLKDGIVSTSTVDMLIGTLIIPVAFMHLKRRNAMIPCQVMRLRAQQFPFDDPGCKKVKDWVDKELKRRNKES